MSNPSENLLTQSEASVVASVPIKVVYKTVAERLPKSSLVRRSNQTLLTFQATVCVRLDYDLPKDVPIKVRRFLYEKVKDGVTGRIEFETVGPSGASTFSYVIDPRPAATAIAERMLNYRRAMDLIVEDPEVQGGIATFRGTRLPVYQVSSLLKQGVPERELIEDYPSLTAERIEAARIFGLAHPRRGRPRRPPWSGGKVLCTQKFPVSCA